MSEGTAGGGSGGRAEGKPTAEMAVLLTFLFGPGMGHFYAGEIRRGALVVGSLGAVGPLLMWLDFRLRFTPILHAVGWFLLLTLLVWIASAIDVGRGRARFQPSPPSRRALRVLAAGVSVVVASLITSGLLRAFVAEAFKVPSGSMFPTLLLGDHFYANKQERRFERGDVVVFSMPAQPEADFVKRVIASGGDVVSVDADGLPTVNDVPARRCALGRAPGLEDGRPVDYFLETLGARSYLVVVDPAARPSSLFPRYEVPSGAVFVLGDNRHNSYDSRMWNEGRGGTVPLFMVKGHAYGIWWSPATESFTARDRALDTPMLPPAAASLQPALAACPR